MELATSLNRNKIDSLTFKYYEVVAIGNLVDYINIGDKVLIPTGIGLSSRVEVPGNDKSLYTIVKAFDGMKSSEIQSFFDKNKTMSKYTEVIEYLGCKAHDVVAVLDESYVIPEFKDNKETSGLIIS
jgi:hypothetical protein